jgi:hypothetical protein
MEEYGVCLAGLRKVKKNLSPDDAFPAPHSKRTPYHSKIYCNYHLTLFLDCLNYEMHLALNKCKWTSIIQFSA